MPTASLAAIPTTPHLSPPAYNAPLIPGYHQLTWMGQWQKPPRPEFTDFPSPGITDRNNPSLNWGTAVFPKCSQEIQIRCITSVDFKNSSDSVWNQASFLRYLPVATVPSQNINRDRYLAWSQVEIDMKSNSVWPIDSARSSLWEVDIRGGIQKYLVTASIRYDALLNWYTGLTLNIVPVIEVEITDSKQYGSLDSNSTWCARTGYGDSFFEGNNFHPLASSNSITGVYDYCLVKSKFASDTVFRVSTQLSPTFTEKKLTHWITSRTTDTRVYSKSLGKDKPMSVTFEGSPVTVQAGVTQIPRNQEGFDSYYAGSPHKTAFDAGKYSSNWLNEFKNNWGIDSTLAGGESWNGAGWDAITQWKATEKYIDPALTIEQHIWEFSAIELVESNDLWVSRCKSVIDAATSFSGVISTNATVFVQGPPRLQSSGALDFQIASTHLRQDGNINIGTYNLSISESVAQCIWGSSTLGLGASISVVSQDGLAQVATTSMGKLEGQLNFAASGFQFSAKKISISLGVQKTSKAVLLPSKTKITCTKGRFVKTVIAVNPRCPKGYKKAS